MKTDKQSITIYIFILFIFGMMCTSCTTYRLTQKQIKINYELDKLYTEYTYTKDSLLIEYYK